MTGLYEVCCVPTSSIPYIVIAVAMFRIVDIQQWTQTTPNMHVNQLHHFYGNDERAEQQVIESIGWHATSAHH